MGYFVAAIVVILIVAAVAYVIRNPQVLVRAQKGIEAAKAEPVQPAAVASRTGLRSGPVSFVERMLTLPRDTRLSFRDPTQVMPVELQEKTRITYLGQTQYGGRGPSIPWVPSGDEWHGLLAVAPRSWSTTDVLILQLSTAGYVLKRTLLGPEESRQFAPYGQEFDKKKQAVGSVQMPWKGKQYAIQDIGMWKVKGLDEEAHLPSNVQARYIVAHADDGTAIIVEDGKGNYDSVWLGWQVDLNRAIVDILTPTGE